MQLDVVTPEGIFFRGEIEMVEFPTSSGELGILPGHAPLMTVVSAGSLRIHRGGKVESYAVAGGFAQVDASSVRILAAFASEESEEEKIEEACQRARDSLDLAGALPQEVRDAELALLKMEFFRLARRKQNAPPG